MSDRLLPALPLIEQICAEQGASVTLTGSNPDFDGPAEAVTVCSNATGWLDRTIRGDTVADCLRAALDAEPIEQAAVISARCAVFADQVEPRYRHGQRTYCCTGTVAKLWQAAWDGACVALGGDPADYRGTPS